MMICTEVVVMPTRKAKAKKAATLLVKERPRSASALKISVATIKRRFSMRSPSGTTKTRPSP